MRILIVTCVLVGVFGQLQADCDQPSVTTASGTYAPTGKICPGDLIFYDEFDTFDLKKWNHEQTLGGGGNWEFEWYTNNRSITWTENSNLVIKPLPYGLESGDDFLLHGQLDINGGSPADECTNPQWYGCSRTGDGIRVLNPVKSGRIRTVYSFSFKYGIVEVRAKVPQGDWIWPAIWMLPRDNAYAGWPASGEIDIVEVRGNRELYNTSNVNIGSQLAGCTLHWGPDYLNNRYPMTHSEKLLAEGFDAAYHLYQLEWTPDNIIFSIDNEEVGRVTPPDGGFWEMGNLDATGYQNPWRSATKMAPFDQEFYLLLNVAVGGVVFFPDDATNNNGKKPWENTSDQATTDFWNGRDQWLPTWKRDTLDGALQVDYVKVWAV